VAHTAWGCFAVAAPSGAAEEVARAKAREELAKVRQHIGANRQKLADGAFLARAPERVAEGARRLLAENLERERLLLQQLGESADH
jgi:valyl-tRNA synthetase